ncbi:RND superfamily putative drug exporter [Motilibacter peucedani]|uniref:RND superfamily putative drug exporter n=1 Tax=Motilibacter peucedani TaxID=598650 RepID=A0A420XQT6_9ACTN|nr:MMPL family transporter [Motilibacter peucedani]RKS75671.1 RND superfamily putative drug exporter [Motilibacter peucedani]
MSATLQQTRPSPPPPARRRGVVTRVASWSAAHRWTALGLWTLFVVVTVALGGIVGTRTQTDAETSVGQSGVVDRVVAKTSFGEKPVENVLFTSKAGPIGTSADAAVADLRHRLAGMEAVADVSAPVTAANGRSQLVRVTLAVPESATPEKAADIAEDAVPAVQDVTAALAKAHPEVTVEQVGDASVDNAVNDVVAEDFGKAEMFSVPVTLVILLMVFGALVAAGVPVLLAITSVASALGLSSLVSHLVPVSPQLSSVVLLVGMAVGVDYSLFYVRREREERARGRAPREAVERAAETAGHAIVVSGLSVIVAMAGLFLSGTATFVSFGIGATLVVAVAMVGSVTALPALLSLLGGVLDRPRVPFLHKRLHQRRVEAARAGSQHVGESRLWGAVLRPVLRSPKAALTVGVGALLLLALPAVGMRLASSGSDALPRTIPEVRSYDHLLAAFPSNSEALTVVVSSTDGKPLGAAATRALSSVASTAPTHAEFAPLTPGDAPEVETSRDGRVARVDVPLSVSSSSPEGHRAVGVLRDTVGAAALDGIPHTSWGVTGSAAWDLDFNKATIDHLPMVLGFVLLMTFLVMLVSFRAPVVALVSIGLNMLSVAASYGLLVLVFQHTWAEGLLHFRSNGAVISWLPLFAFVILFGLSMDYTVLVVSRIKEALEAGLPTQEAVRVGITRTAGVVTSAAVIMVAVFSIFATLSLLEFKQMGVGLAAAILIDATVVRAVLLPAALALLGDRAWPRKLTAGRLTPVAGTARGLSVPRSR